MRRKHARAITCRDCYWHCSHTYGCRRASQHLSLQLCTRGGHSPFNINEIQNDKDAQYTPAEAMGTYIGSFILGAIPGVNLIVYSCDMKTWGKDTIDAAGLKAGMATDVSVPLAIVLYFAFLRR